jgi:hypothetical protein
MLVLALYVTRKMRSSIEKKFGFFEFHSRFLGVYNEFKSNVISSQSIFYFKI